MDNIKANILAILSSDSADLRYLANLVGEDPLYFYVGQDLSKCDLRSQDLRNISFDGSTLAGATIDSETRVDAKYDVEIRKGADYFFPSIPRYVMEYVDLRAVAKGYRYYAYEYQTLIRAGKNLFDGKSMKSHCVEILTSDEVERRIFDQSPRDRKVRKLNLKFADIRVAKKIEKTVLDIESNSGQYWMGITSLLLLGIASRIESHFLYESPRPAAEILLGEMDLEISKSPPNS